MANYAKIDMSTPGAGVGTVVDIQVLSNTDPMDSNFTWVDIDSVTCSDGTPVIYGCTYDGDDFTSLVIAPTLAQAKQLAIQNFYSAMQGFTQAAYPDSTRLTLLILYIMAENSLKINRANYIAQALNWSTSVLTYAQTVITSIQGAATVAAVEAITWDIVDNVGANPNVTLLGAIAINN